MAFFVVFQVCPSGLQVAVALITTWQAGQFIST
jgi:hypothetical protein